MGSLAVLLALGCATDAARRAPPDPSTRAIELEIIRLTNAYRRTHSLPPLREDADLAALARGHSRDMAGSGGSIEHDGVRARFESAATSLRISKFAENVARSGSHLKAGHASWVVSGWIRSEAHRVHLEGPFGLVGVGVVRHPSGAVYFTQIFAAVRRDDAPHVVPASIDRRAASRR
jgi:uncharacterized protein YkwD